MKARLENMRARVTDDWIPLPDDAVSQLGWKEGDVVECEIVDGALIIRKAEAAPQVSKPHDRTCPAYGNYQPPYEQCDCGAE